MIQKRSIKLARETTDRATVVAIEAADHTFARITTPANQSIIHFNLTFCSYFFSRDRALLRGRLDFPILTAGRQRNIGTT